MVEGVLARPLVNFGERYICSGVGKNDFAVVFSAQELSYLRCSGIWKLITILQVLLLRRSSPH